MYRMNAEQLIDAMNFLDEDLIREAEETRSRVIRRSSWHRWGALAACVAVAVFAGTQLMPKTAPQPPQSLEIPSSGASGPSQPASADLPMITIQSTGASGFGFEGYMAFDIDELESVNPWTKEVTVKFLPVYENPITYDSMLRPTGANERKMKALLLDTAQKLGLDIQNTPITDNTPSEEQQKAITEKMAAVGEEVPEGYFDPTTLIMEGNGIKIEVD